MSLQCYCCKHDKFNVHLVAKDIGVDVITGLGDSPSDPNVATEPYPIETILCARCGLLQYVASRTDSPWFTNNTNFIWDEERQILVEPSRVRYLEKKSVPKESFATAIKSLTEEEKLEILKSLGLTKKEG